MDNRELQHEEQKATELKPLSAQGIHHALLWRKNQNLGVRPLRSLGPTCLWGFYGLVAACRGVLHAHLPETGWRTLVTATGYSAGFVAVMLGRQQLYTETTLTAFLPLLHQRTRGTLSRVLRLWSIVLVANLAGALLFSWPMAHPSVAGPELREAFSFLAHKAAKHDAWSAFSAAFSVVGSSHLRRGFCHPPDRLAS